MKKTTAYNSHSLGKYLKCLTWKLNNYSLQPCQCFYFDNGCISIYQRSLIISKLHRILQARFLEKCGCMKKTTAYNSHSLGKYLKCLIWKLNNYSLQPCQCFYFDNGCISIYQRSLIISKLHRILQARFLDLKDKAALLKFLLFVFCMCLQTKKCIG